MHQLKPYVPFVVLILVIDPVGGFCVLLILAGLWYILHGIVLVRTLHTIAPENADDVFLIYKTPLWSDEVMSQWGMGCFLIAVGLIGLLVLSANLFR